MQTEISHRPYSQGTQGLFQTMWTQTHRDGRRAGVAVFSKDKARALRWPHGGLRAHPASRVDWGGGQRLRAASVKMQGGLAGGHRPSEGCVGVEVGVGLEKALGWESWDQIVKGPVSGLHSGGGKGALQSVEVIRLPPSLRRADCSRGGGTGVREGWRRGILSGRGQKGPEKAE